MSTLSTSAIATFVAVSDAARARDFYESKLGLTFVSEDEYAIELNGNGTSLRIQKGVTFTPQQFTVLGWHVEDIVTAKAELESRGVEFEQYPWLPPESNGIMEFPGGAKVAWFKDPDGNVLSLDQY